MKNKSKETKEGQVQYLGRWVNKNMFRAFVYDNEGNEKLADSYKEFEELTSSGIWFASKPTSKVRKTKDAVCSTS